LQKLLLRDIAKQGQFELEQPNEINQQTRDEIVKRWMQTAVDVLSEQNELKKSEHKQIETLWQELHGPESINV
jgi:hypothetical protein